MQNRHSRSLRVHFHTLRCSLLYSQPQPEQQPEKAPGWQQEPMPEPAPAPASGEMFPLSGLGGRKFPRKHHHPTEASQTHRSLAPGRQGESSAGGKCPVPALAPRPSRHCPLPSPTSTSARSVLLGRAAPGSLQQLPNPSASSETALERDEDFKPG